MSNFAHVEKVTKEVGGRTITFRAKLEYRWAVWCQLRKEQGIIVDWQYESVQVKVKTKLGEIKIYRPDFTILSPCPNCVDGKIPEIIDDHIISPNDLPCPKCDGFGDTVEYEETKGWFQAKDYTKMKLMAEQYDNPLTLIFANLTNCKSNRLIYGRAKGIEKLLKSNGGRVIFDANKTIFKPIKYLFEV